MKIPISTKAWVGLLKKDIGARAFLYLVVLVIWVYSLIFWQAIDKSIFEGLFIEVTGIVLTLFVIDLLLRTEKKERLNKANELNTKLVESMAGFSVSLIASTVGHTVTIDDFSETISTNDFKTKVQSLIDSDEMKSYISKYENLNKGIIRLIDILQKNIEINRKRLSESLHKMYPAPNPKIIDRIDRAHLEMRGSLEARKSMVEIILIKVPKEFKNQSAKDKKIYKDGTEAMWRFVINRDGKDSLGSIKTNIDDLLKDYLFIKHEARKNNLHFDI